MEQNIETTVDVLILAGGRGERLEGLDKGLVPLAGKPMIGHVIERLLDQTSSITISFNRNEAGYQKLIDDYRQQSNNQVHFELISDPPEYRFHGPSAGIASMLEKSNANLVFVCPCDTPLIPDDIVRTLNQLMHHHSAEAVYPVQSQQNQHLVLLLNRKAALSAIQTARIEQPNPSVKHWLALLNTKTCQFPPDSRAFSNINTLNSLKSIELLLN